MDYFSWLHFGYAKKTVASKPADDAQASYYNECAKNSVLYDLCGDLITALELCDCNNPILDTADQTLSDHGFSFGKPVKEEPLEALANSRGYSWMSGEYAPTGDYLIRARGTDVHSISWKGTGLDDAKANARTALNAMPLMPAKAAQ